FQDSGASGSSLSTIAAIGQGRRLTCPSYRPAGGGLSAPRPIRHCSFPYRLPSLPDVASRFVSARDHLARPARPARSAAGVQPVYRSEEHTSELQSLAYLVCRLLLEKKNTHSLNI